jgi:hypothetical protein
MTLLLAALLLLSPMGDTDPRAFRMPKKKVVKPAATATPKVATPVPVKPEGSVEPAAPIEPATQTEAATPIAPTPTPATPSSDVGPAPLAFQLPKRSAPATPAPAVQTPEPPTLATPPPAAPTPRVEEKSVATAAPKGTPSSSFTLPGQTPKPKKTGKKQPVTFKLPEKKN